MFSPVDFHSDMSRFRRHMNHLFHDFDRSFPTATGLAWNQDVGQALPPGWGWGWGLGLPAGWDAEFGRQIQLDSAATSAMAAAPGTAPTTGTEQKESGEHKQPAAANQMAVGSTGTDAAPAAAPASGGAIALSAGTPAPAAGPAAEQQQQQQPPQHQQLFQPWGLGWGAGSGSAALVPSLTAISTPRWDVVENSDHFLVKCDLPGMSKDDVKVSVSADGVLSISAERSEQHEQKDDKRKYHRIERSYGKYKRSLQLPNNVDAEALKAKQENGLLEIMLPKKPVEKHPKKQERHVPIH